MHMLWIRVAIIGVIVAALAAAAIKVTSYLNEKDRMVQERDQNIANLVAKVSGLQIDKDRLEQSNKSLEADARKKSEELKRAQDEFAKQREIDATAAKNVAATERKLNDRKRIEQIERLRTSERGAERMLKVWNKSAKCELENFFQPSGICKNGEWVVDGGPLTPAPPAAARPDSAAPTPVPIPASKQTSVGGQPVGDSR
jgi:uncharacterized protein YoxC